MITSFTPDESTAIYLSSPPTSPVPAARDTRRQLSCSGSGINGQQTALLRRRARRFRCSALQLQSYGAPDLDGEQMSVSLVTSNPGTVDAGAVEVVDSTASLNIDLAALNVQAGNYTLVVAHEATGTEVRAAVELTGQQTDATATPTETPKDAPAPEHTEAPLSAGEDSDDDMSGTGGLADTGAQIIGLVLARLLAVGVGTALVLTRRKVAHEPTVRGSKVAFTQRIAPGRHAPGAIHRKLRRHLMRESHINNNELVHCVLATVDRYNCSVDEPGIF